MTCDQAIDAIHASLDGELDPDALRALEDHLAGCESCREVHAGTAALLARARALPRAVEPRRDLWPAIRARLDARRRTRWRAPLLLAAAALLAVGAGWLALRPGSPPPAPAVEVAARAWERELEAATAELEVALAARRDAIDPATWAVVEQNLAIIDRAIADTRAALAEVPDDPAREAALQATLRHKVRVLRQVADLADARG